MKKVFALVMAIVMVVAMFAGFVADEDYPLAFIVVVEGGGYGSATCIPILTKVLNSCKSVLDA